MLLAVVPAAGLGEPEYLFQLLTAAGEPAGEPTAATMAELAATAGGAAGPRWAFESVAAGYPPMSEAGLRVRRAHDVGLTERILLGRAGRFGEPISARAVLARRDGLEVPDDPAAPPGHAEVLPSLFDTSPPPAPPSERLAALIGAVRDQLDRTGDEFALKLLLAAESGAALAAVEMTRAGLPFDAAIHRAQLTALIGDRPAPGTRPRVLAELATEIEAEMGFPLNPDSPADLLVAFRRLGYDVASARAHALERLDHPAVPLVLHYKELARLAAANGWAWLDEWVTDGRFRAGYVPGGVVSGRWAAHGGGGLQLPRSVRPAVLADPGHLLVVADAAQLEPRVLAAISTDPVLRRAADDEDLYGALTGADGGFADRAQAKVAMLGAMYGATSGQAGQLLGRLRERYPVAMSYLETAAATGERGGAVRSVLGRASPPPGPGWWSTVTAGSQPDADAAAERHAREAARGWGRFTRNFVVQASASDWASVWLSLVRTGLPDLPGAELVLFQHDEILVHTPAELADPIATLLVTAAEQAGRLVFGDGAPRLPVRPVAVRCYADAK